jgi:hypothetical protein
MVYWGIKSYPAYGLLPCSQNTGGPVPINRIIWYKNPNRENAHEPANSISEKRGRFKSGILGYWVAKQRALYVLVGPDFEFVTTYR